jgi:MoxR-like ATPase
LCHDAGHHRRRQRVISDISISSVNEFKRPSVDQPSDQSLADQPAAADEPGVPGPKLAAEHLRAVVAQACRGLVQRETLVELVVLCAVAREHLLVIGPPGTAKSEAVRRIARGLGGVYFEYLIGRFTEPSEIFGPVNLRRLKEGFVETETAGMLPEAEIAFLDEVFLGSTAILNTLLTILNERTFRRGHTMMKCPLRVCVGASNHLPEDEHLAALADRFLVRAFVEPIGDSGLEELLSSGWSLGRTPDRALASLTDLDQLTAAALAMDLTAARPAIAHGLRLLRSTGIALSDRRVVRIQRLIAAAAALAGRERPTAADLWPLVFALPTDAAQSLGRDVLRDLLAASESGTLLSAPAEGSLGPLAKAARIVRDGDALLAEAPQDGPDGENDPAAREGAREVREIWRLRVEGIAREIDAAFTRDTLPPDVAALRKRIVDVLGADAEAA